MGLPSLPNGLGRYLPSKQLIAGSDINAIGDLLISFQQVVATPSGSVTTSIRLNAANVEITAVATAADGVLLPPAKAGLTVAILNSDAADAAQVFAGGGNTINATAGATGVSLAAGAAAIFKCIKDGNWRRFVSA